MNVPCDCSRDGVGTDGVGPASDGSPTGSGSSSGSSSGSGPEQHLSATCHPHNRSILQSNDSTGETPPQKPHTCSVVRPQHAVLLHRNVSLQPRRCAVKPTRQTWPCAGAGLVLTGLRTHGVTGFV